MVSYYLVSYMLSSFFLDEERSKEIKAGQFSAQAKPLARPAMPAHASPKWIFEVGERL